MDDGQIQESNEPDLPDLLYFFISGNRLYELYKKLFINNRLYMPFDIQIVKSDPRTRKREEHVGVIEFGIKDRYIIDINIKIENGNITTFENKMYGTTKTMVHNGYGYFLLNHVNSVDENVKKILTTYLNLNENVTCNVTCRFFIIGKKVEDITLSSYDNIIEKNHFLLNDKKKVKNVFIGDDFFYKANKVKNIALLRDLTDQPKIILLPCLHDKNIYNPCSYNNNQISDNCSFIDNNDNNIGNDNNNIGNYDNDNDNNDNNNNNNNNNNNDNNNIDTTLYTNFYGDDKIRKTSFFSYSNRGHCRDTNLISLVLNTYYSTASSTNRIEENGGGRRKKITKKSKKIRRPRKKSRKTRKHKKSRKN